tara:strand:- start:882 stop:1100 length:219 start_codon:yes stop_codon:yes gene_type:complete
MGIVEDVINTNLGKVIISIIWGLGLATLFRKVCKGRKCLIIKGPKPEDMDNKVYKFDDKCYLYKSKNTTCKK